MNKFPKMAISSPLQTSKLQWKKGAINKAVNQLKKQQPPPPLKQLNKKKTPPVPPRSLAGS